jgi:hypothetical protein
MITEKAGDMDTIVKALNRQVVIAQTGDGEVWSGTDTWLIREASVKRPPTEKMDALLDNYDVVLTRATWDGFEMLVRSYAGLFRAYVRDDKKGETVFLSDAFVKAVEQLLETEDESGDVVDSPLVFKQSLANRLAQVGVFRGDTLVGMVMPVRNP